MNLKEIKGRQVAVDWAIPKDKFVATQQSSSAARKKSSKKLLPSDVKEGRTIFIRNLSFDTEEEGLEEVLLQYGELNYIKIVLHSDTEHSKGCAFAQFKTKEAADKCIAASQDEEENGGIRVDGRKLLIVAAVSREDAAKLKVDKVKVETGSRNLYLAREGLIRAGTKAAEGVPEADMIKRTRCRVMYDKKPQKGQSMGQSLGYGFVQFQDHEHALSTLRYLNNNPDIFGTQKRPIVEFSLEDMRKLKIKEMRHQKSKQFPGKGGAKPRSQADGPGFKKGTGKAQSSSEVTGRERAPPQNQKKGRNYSGFQTNPEVEHVDLENGKKRRKILPLPSHRGPKIRMRDKGKQKAPPPKTAGPGSNRRERQRQQMQKPTQSRKQVKAAKKHFKRKDGDRFDSLVEQYKKKLMGNRNRNRNRNLHASPPFGLRASARSPELRATMTRTIFMPQ
ncbi:hypothetical protein INR49_021614 [Caranx melampygus]|nr:hypothetical protein INR49_021614 [Caranx melampygus]